MNQQEKSQISYNKILNAAIMEFGTDIYENVSINSICLKNNISKGLIYHYFKSKDDLYLTCIKVCFEKLIINLDKPCNLSDYINLRYDFFCKHENYGNIFFNSVLRPPAHLVCEIKEIRKKFDSVNLNHYRLALKSVTLRDGITEEEAIEYFYIFQEMFNGYFQSKSYQNSDFHSLIEAHEINLSKMINIMFFGIVKEK